MVDGGGGSGGCCCYCVVVHVSVSVHCLYSMSRCTVLDGVLKLFFKL